MKQLGFALLACVAAGPAFAQLFPSQQPKPKHFTYTPPHREFTCEVPTGWQAFQEETLQGSSVHFMGPAEADGAFRAAIHVHYIQRGKPGFVPLETAVKRERRSDSGTSRDVSPIVFWHAAKAQARRFEVNETRQLPRDVMPSRPVELHHYYVFIPAGDSYFMIKLSSTRETYLNYKADFERLLSSFQGNF